MAMWRTWAGPAEGAVGWAEVGDYVPGPVTAQEAAEVLALAQEQWALLGPEDDPECAEYWQAWDDIAATMAA